MGGSRIGDGKAAERGVEVVELLGPGRGWIALVIRLVWPCQKPTVEATMTPSGRLQGLGDALDHLGGIVDGLVAGCQYGHERSPVGAAEETRCSSEESPTES